MLWLLLACGEPPVGRVQGQCADCHTEQAELFARSAHAEVDGSEVFTALLEEVEATGGDGDACVACHTPMSCVTCHSAVGHQGVSDGALVHDPLGGVQAPSGGGHGAPHQLERGGFLEEAALCGTCHDASGPAGFVETPFQHWQESPAGAQGETCQDCHGGHPAAVSREPESWFPGVIELSREGDDVVVTHTGRGHRLPDGAAFLRQLSVETEAWIWVLSPVPARGGVEVSSPVLADGVVGTGLQPGESRRRALPAGMPAIDVCVVYHRYAPALLEHLGFAVEPGTPVLCERL